MSTDTIAKWGPSNAGTTSLVPQQLPLTTIHMQNAAKKQRHQAEKEEPKTKMSSPHKSPQEPPINLLRGWPHPSLLPTPLLITAAQHTLSHPSTSVPALSYGPDAGHFPARAAIAS